MIVVLPAALFLVAAGAAYLRGGVVRLLATAGMLAATAWALLFTTSGRVAVGWLLPLLLATLLLSRPRSAERLSFEALTRRVTTIAAAGLVALFAASKFPVGENPTVLSAVPWLLAAVGAAWLVSPLDEKERLQALVLLIGGGAAVLIAASPVGVITAFAAGAMALPPVIAARWQLAARLDHAVRVLLLVAAAVSGARALFPPALPRPALADLALSLDGLALAAVAALLVAGALLAPAGRSWVGVPALVALVAVAPALRWAALAALVAAALRGERLEERYAWFALFVLSLTTLFGALVGQPWSGRAQIAGLAAVLVLMTLTALSGVAVLLLVAFSLVVLELTASANANLMTRFQWVAAAGAGLLLVRTLLRRRAGQHEGRLEDSLILGILLLAIAAHDPLGLGQLAAVLLLIELVLINHRFADRDARGRATRLLADVGRSGWPPAVRFAGVTLAVTAALQTSLAWGLMSALFLAALKVAPIFERHRTPSPPGAGWIAAPAWLAPALSLACGLLPAVVLRMLRV